MKHLKQTFVCLRQGVHLIWSSEAKSASCSQKPRETAKKRWIGGGEGHHLFPPQTPAQLTFQFFSPFPPTVVPGLRLLSCQCL